MGGFFGVASKNECKLDVFFGTDYHSHLGTRRAGMAFVAKDGSLSRIIHDISNAPSAPASRKNWKVSPATWAWASSATSTRSL